MSEEKTMSDFAERAAKYEMDQRLFEDEVLASDETRDAFIEECEQANWPEVVATYDNSTLHRVNESGTNFHFSTELFKTINEAARNEAGKRAPPPSDDHGMTE